MRQQAASRKDKIMREALLLFAEKGYIDTSTKIIAQQAGVSEALIFKHFGNKDNLLSHLIKSGYRRVLQQDRKSTRLNSSHVKISYAVFCLKKKKTKIT